MAPLRKLRVGHDGKGSRPDWYLEKVYSRILLVEEMDSYLTYLNLHVLTSNPQAMFSYIW